MNIIVCGHLIPVHSVCEAITNSSTVVYTYPAWKAIDNAKELFQNILSVLGLSDKVEDCFDIQISYKDGAKTALFESMGCIHKISDLLEKCKEIFPDADFDSIATESFVDKWEYVSGIMKIFKDHFNAISKEEQFEIFEEYLYDAELYKELNIIPKNNPSLDIGKLFLSLFESREAEY